MGKRKTTLMIEDSLYDALRMQAAKKRMSVSDIVAEAAAKYLVSEEAPRPKFRLPRVQLMTSDRSTLNSNWVKDLCEEMDREALARGKNPGLL